MVNPIEPSERSPPQICNMERRSAVTSIESSPIEDDDNDESSSAEDLRTDSSNEAPVDNVAPEDDVVPEIIDDDPHDVCILLPGAIRDNIYIMLILASEIETNLNSFTRVTRLTEKIMKQLVADIRQFRNSFRNLVNVIHQIQLLNVTTNWEHTFVTRYDDRRKAVLKIVGLNEKLPHHNLAWLNSRTHIMLDLLGKILPLLARYENIRPALNSTINRFDDLIARHRHSDSDDDDPRRPLLGERNSGLSSRAINEWVQTVFSLRDILFNSIRCGLEISDSVEAMRDLIRWEYILAVRALPLPSESTSSRSASIVSESSLNTNSVQTWINRHGGFLSVQAEQMDPDPDFIFPSSDHDLCENVVLVVVLFIIFLFVFFLVLHLLKLY